MLKEATYKFVQSLEGKSTLMPLYKQKSLIVEVIGKEEPIWLKINAEGHQVCHSRPVEDVSLVISGSEDKLIEIALMGKRPLLALKEEGGLQVTGPFSHQLTLESLFILSGEQSFLVL